MNVGGANESGHLNLNKRGAKLLFQIFTGPRRCAAITDRLTVKGALIQAGTDSCLLKETDYLLKEAATEHQASGRS